MRTKLVATLVAFAFTGLAFSACSSEQIGGDVIAPSSVEVNDLDGTTVGLQIGQTLGIDTGEIAVESFTATISDPAIASFTRGESDADASFNPGFTGESVGTTSVTLDSEDPSFTETVEFTIEVNE